MELLKGGAILLILGFAIEVASTFIFGKRWISKLGHSIAQVVMLIGVLLGVVGLFSLMF